MIGRGEGGNLQTKFLASSNEPISQTLIMGDVSSLLLPLTPSSSFLPPYIPLLPPSLPPSPSATITIIEAGPPAVLSQLPPSIYINKHTKTLIFLLNN